MPSSALASTTNQSTGSAPARAGVPTRSLGKSDGGRWTLGILATALFAAGAGAGYLAAYVQYDEKIAAVTQADELRVNAKNDRIRELEEQQREIARHADEQEREFEQQASAQQRALIAQADARERKLTQQASAQERALLAQADARERQLAQPDLPVRVWVRKAMTGNAIVARLHNFGEKELVLAVTVRRSQTDKHSTWNVDVAPSGTQVIGKEQGWTFAAGDQIDVVANGFRPLTFYVPYQVRQ
ncbi:MAG TPA: hypothetical protein VEI05_01950 [Burkholderiaceae bacterium]|nr:hypothetical protein [Burkholderiaceae bacterium]